MMKQPINDRPSDPWLDYNLNRFNRRGDMAVPRPIEFKQAFIFAVTVEWWHR